LSGLVGDPLLVGGLGPGAPRSLPLNPALRGVIYDHMKLHSVNLSVLFG